MASQYEESKGTKNKHRLKEKFVISIPKVNTNIDFVSRLSHFRTVLASIDL